MDTLLGKAYMIFCLLSCHQIPSYKGIYSKRKEFAPQWSKFFPFRVDPFIGEDLVTGKPLQKHAYLKILKILTQKKKKILW